MKIDINVNIKKATVTPDNPNKESMMTKERFLAKAAAIAAKLEEAEARKKMEEEGMNIRANRRTSSLSDDKIKLLSEGKIINSITVDDVRDYISGILGEDSLKKDIQSYTLTLFNGKGDLGEGLYIDVILTPEEKRFYDKYLKQYKKTYKDLGINLKDPNVINDLELAAYREAKKKTKRKVRFNKEESVFFVFDVALTPDEYKKYTYILDYLTRKNKKEQTGIASEELMRRSLKRLQEKLLREENLKKIKELREKNKNKLEKFRMTYLRDEIKDLRKKARTIALDKIRKEFQIGREFMLETDMKFDGIESFKHSSPKRNAARYRGQKTMAPIGISNVLEIGNIFGMTVQEKKDAGIYVKGQGIVEKPQETVRERTKLNRVRLPAKYLKNEIIKSQYGAVVAATFFQLLVSNTPIDEKYDFIEKKVKTSSRRVKMTERIKNDEGVYVTVTRNIRDVVNEIAEKSKVYNIKRVHIPDSDRIRDDWLFHYKGKTFRSGDFPPDLFVKKGDKESVNIIASVFQHETEDTPDTNINFTYENINKRYSLIEYGGYYKDKTGPNTGAKYGSLYEHGVINGRTWQAPYGVKRAVEALWNHLTSKGLHAGYVCDFINFNRNQLDVSKIKSNLMKKITGFNSVTGEMKASFTQVGFIDDDDFQRIYGTRR